MRKRHWFRLIAVILVGLVVQSQGAEIKVACLGDSITAGKNVQEAQRYPAVLQNRLGPGYQVRNFGVGGATLLKEGRPNVWSMLDAASAFEPDIVIIALGTNDTVGGNRKNWDHEAKFIPQYRELIRKLRSLGSHPRILVCTPSDMVTEKESLSADRRANLVERHPRLLDLCERIRKLSELDGVTVVEWNPVLRGHPEWVTDGVHPTAEGYQALAEALLGPVKVAASQ